MSWHGKVRKRHAQHNLKGVLQNSSIPFFASFHLLDSKIQNEVKFGQAFVHVAPLELWNVVCELGRNLVLDDCGRNCWPSDNPVKAKRNMARACDLLLSL